MLGGRAITIVSVLRADAVAVLRDFPRDPVSLWKRGDNIAHQLCLPDVARVTANDNYAPVRR